MSSTETKRDDTHPSVHLFVALVTILAIALTAMLYGVQHQIVPSSKIVYIALFCVLLFVGETRSNWFRFADGGEVTPGWAFAFGIVLFGAPIVAILAMAGCTMYVDLHDRKPLTKVAFNTAQITTSLAAGALVLQLFGLGSPITDVDRLSYRWGAGILLAGAVVFTLNGLLTSAVLALHYQTRLRSMLDRSFLVSISADGALLALSPIFVVAIDFSLLMLPSMGITALLIYQSTQQALKRAHEASHDGLTRLLNRRTFDHHLTGFLDSKVDLDISGAVLLLDLDGFKEVNDRLGHQTGDQVLIAIANRLSTCAPDNALVSRLGGDEFAMLIPDVGSAQEMMAAVEQMRLEVIRPIDIDGFPITVGISIGLAVVPTHGRTAEDLMSAADVAMYRAKRDRTGVEVYQALGPRSQRGRLGLLGELTNALAENQLSVHYQPLTRFRDGACDGVEALLRWDHPTLGNVPPSDFITLAEHTDLIGPLTQFVLKQSTSDAPMFTNFGVHLSVNVSARNIQDRRFASTVFRALSDAQLSPSQLVLEITESAIAQEPERSLYTIDALRVEGVLVAIDDFGTGYSSFSMLRDITVDRLKIDSSFIDSIASSERRQHLVKAIVDLAAGLGVQTVAEGVEDSESWAILASLGCDIAQGFYVSRPLALPQLVDWLDTRRAPVIEVLAS